MKQLLLWCAERTMQDQNNTETNKKEKINYSNNNNIPKSILDKGILLR